MLPQSGPQGVPTGGKWFSVARRAQIGMLEEHPNAEVILGVLAQAVDIPDGDLTRLAASWRNTDDVATARDKALQPDSPLIVEVLAAFESLGELFAEDLAGQEPYLTVPAPVTALALKAVRDAIAAAYARPILTTDEYAALSRAWQDVYPGERMQMPDFGPQHYDVVAVLQLVTELSCHSHDAAAGSAWDALLEELSAVDVDAHASALDAAWAAAVVSRRRRLWRLVDRSCRESFFRQCPECSTKSSRDDAAVLRLCVGALMGALLRDVLDDASIATLESPLAALVPDQRVS